MSRALMILGFLGFAFFAQVAAHGHLSVPTTRDYLLRQDQQNAPVEFPLGSDFVCRNYSATPSSKWTTLVAGSTTPMTWALEAPHPGDCFAYLTYDGDNVADTQKKWFKIASFPKCNLNNLQQMTLNIPSYLPSCDHCILRWEWYALHLQSIDIVEFYSQCSDVKIIGNPNGRLPTPQVTIPGHLPMDAKHYRPGFNSDASFLTGPPEATVGGAAYSCLTSYGSSCNVPSPTKNPCVISTQRCTGSSTYQACGIGATTTVWGPDQSCQTGLVCANHTDGLHIMCTYPTIPTTPSSTPSSPSSPSAGSSTPTGTCKLSNMKCVSDSSYQTCSMGNTGTYWATSQSCQAGLYCNPNGETVFCGPNKPATSTTPSTPSTTGSTPVVVIPPVPAPIPVIPAPVTAPTVPVVVSPPVVVSTTGVKSTPASTKCLSGDQRCTGTLSSTYQTCTIQRDGSTAWAAPQSCQTGLKCNPSQTANNIYCY